MLEKTVKAAVKKRLKELGVYQHWPVQMGYGAVTLDCIACYQGRYVAIECKRPDGKPTALQKLTMQQIRAAGGEVYVIDSVEAANELFANDRFQGNRTDPRSI